MDSMEVTVVVTVLVLAVVQSVFGVGLLVFGTPTLLLLGYPFDQVLAYLLPCSILISALQVRARAAVCGATRCGAGSSF